MTLPLVCRYDGRSLVILDRDKGWVFVADPLGRIAWVHMAEAVYRRSRFDQWFSVKRGQWAYLEPVEPARIAALVESWRPLWIRAQRQSTESGRRDGLRGISLSGILEQWSGRFMDYHREDAQRFRSIYERIPILPPDAYQALYIQLAVGCPWNRCLFCDFYGDRPYRVRGQDELLRHLTSVRSYWEGAVGSRMGLFLGDANAVAIPADLLAKQCDLVREVFPEKRFRALCSFADFFSGRRRVSDEFDRLRALGLTRICLGVESGDPGLMVELCKPVRSEDVVRTVQQARSGGVTVSLIFIVGLGGRRHRESHFHRSMELVSQLPLRRPDRIYLSPLTLAPELGYFEAAEKLDWGYLGDEAMDTEMIRWKEAIRRLKPNLPVSLYNIRLFTY